MERQDKPDPHWNVQPLRTLIADAGAFRYDCPDGHIWFTIPTGDPPLVNIKCPTCQKTAMQRKEGQHD